MISGKFRNVSFVSWILVRVPTPQVERFPIFSRVKKYFGIWDFCTDFFSRTFGDCQIASSKFEIKCLYIGWRVEVKITSVPPKICRNASVNTTVSSKAVLNARQDVNGCFTREWRVSTLGRIVCRLNGTWNESSRKLNTKMGHCSISQSVIHIFACGKFGLFLTKYRVSWEFSKKKKLCIVKKKWVHH